MNTSARTGPHIGVFHCFNVFPSLGVKVFYYDFNVFVRYLPKNRDKNGSMKSSLL